MYTLLQVHVGEMKIVALLVCEEWEVSLFITFFSIFFLGGGIGVRGSFLFFVSKQPATSTPKLINMQRGKSQDNH